MISASSWRSRHSRLAGFHILTQVVPHHVCQQYLSDIFKSDTLRTISYGLKAHSALSIGTELVFLESGKISLWSLTATLDMLSPLVHHHILCWLWWE